mgnify:CR=1 FL=1
MFGKTFYHGLIRKYVILFGTLFNNIYINRKASTSTDAGYTQTIKVPLSYGPKEKFLARAAVDPSLNRPIATVLPRMSFEFTNIVYAPERKLSTIQKLVTVDPADPQKLKYQYNPVPYDFNFGLSIMVKNAEDGTRILEQIMPYFTPEWTSTVNLIPDMNLKFDIPVSIQAVNYSDTYEGDFETRRAVIWDLDFLLKGYLFGPIKSSKVINLANIQMYVSKSTPVTNVTAAEERVKITPGLTANGTATSNASASIARSLIEADDDFGFITEFEGIDNE